MRSLSEAGIGWRPPFIKADLISDRPFEILRAESRPSSFNRGDFEIVLQARVLAYPGVSPLFDNDGDEITMFSWSAALRGQREDIVRFFQETPHETLGPVQFMWLETNNGTENAFVSIEDYAGERPAWRAPAQHIQAPRVPSPPPIRPPAGPAATPRSQLARNYPNRPRVVAPSVAGSYTAGPPARSTHDEMPPEWPDDDVLS